MIKIRKIDVLDVYPKGERLYFDKKWAIIAYELQCGHRDIVGIMDMPLPKESDDIHPLARDALMKCIARGTFALYDKKEYAHLNKIAA